VREEERKLQVIENDIFLSLGEVFN